MRISSSMIYSAGYNQINDLQAQLVQTQQEISSGKSFLTPADNPVAASEALIVTQNQADNTQFGANRQSATNGLSHEETTLAGVTTLIQDAQSAVVNAGNGAYTPAERHAIAISLQGTYNQLLGLANAQDGNGNYLFSGYRNGVQPFSPTAAGAQYNGDQGQTSVQVGASQQMPIGDSGDSVFQSNLTGNGTFTTAAAAANIGTGVVSSGGVVNAAALTGDNYKLTFSGIVTAAVGGNVGTGAISSGTAIVGGPAATGHTFSIQFTSGTTYNIVDTTSATTVSSGNSYLAGQTISAGSAQFSITGNPVGGDQFTVTDNPTTYTVADTSVPPSALANPPVGPQPYVSGQSIQFDGLQFNITGSPSNGDIFTLGSSTKQSVFTTLTNLINLLNSPAGIGATGNTILANGLNTAGNNLSNALNNILTVRASVGARLNELSSLDTVGTDLNLQYSTTLSSLTDVNYAKAISQYSQEQTTLTAAQQSFVKISNLSLFNYIA